LRLAADSGRGIAEIWGRLTVEDGGMRRKAPIGMHTGPTKFGWSSTARRSKFVSIRDDQHGIGGEAASLSRNSMAQGRKLRGRPAPLFSAIPDAKGIEFAGPTQKLAEVESDPETGPVTLTGLIESIEVRSPTRSKSRAALTPPCPPENRIRTGGQCLPDLVPNLNTRLRAPCVRGEAERLLQQLKQGASPDGLWPPAALGSSPENWTRSRDESGFPDQNS
jgi:hypothetical protein